MGIAFQLKREGTRTWVRSYYNITRLAWEQLRRKTGDNNNNNASSFSNQLRKSLQTQSLSHHLNISVSLSQREQIMLTKKKLPRFLHQLMHNSWAYHPYIIFFAFCLRNTKSRSRNPSIIQNDSFLQSLPLVWTPNETTLEKMWQGVCDILWFV